MEYAQIFADTMVGFFALFLLTKFLGKSQITQITAFDFIAALVLGELVGNALYDKEVSIPQILFAVILWGLLIYVTETLTQKFKKTRAMLEGKPNIIIHKGKLQKKTMSKGKLDINQLQHLLRSKDVFSIQEVEYAILETDGTISVLKKSMMQNPTRGDLNLQPQQVVLPATMINDGEVIWDNLSESGLDKEWLQQELAKQNIPSYQQVFYAEYKEGEALYVVKY